MTDSPPLYSNSPLCFYNGEKDEQDRAGPVNNDLVPSIDILEVVDTRPFEPVQPLSLDLGEYNPSAIDEFLDWYALCSYATLLVLKAILYTGSLIITL